MLGWGESLFVEFLPPIYVRFVELCVSSHFFIGVFVYNGEKVFMAGVKYV